VVTIILESAVAGLLAKLTRSEKVVRIIREMNSFQIERGNTVAIDHHTLGNLAYSYYQAGQHERAYIKFQQRLSLLDGLCVDIQADGNKPLFWATIETLKELSSLCLTLKLYEQAERLLLRLGALQKDSPLDTGIHLTSFAELYQMLGKTDGALKCALKSIDFLTRSEVAGREIPFLKKAHLIAGRAYLQKQDFSQACHHFIQAQEIQSDFMPNLQDCAVALINYYKTTSIDAFNTLTNKLELAMRILPKGADEPELIPYLLHSACISKRIAERFAPRSSPETPNSTSEHASLKDFGNLPAGDESAMYYKLFADGEAGTDFGQRALDRYNSTHKQFLDIARDRYLQALASKKASDIPSDAQLLKNLEILGQALSDYAYPTYEFDFYRRAG
jgi:tetratricopeptide (TPR) repeat protein